MEVKGGFWGPRFRTNRDVTLWHAFRCCEDTGRIANFSRAGGFEAGTHEGRRYDDSDVFKVVEGAAYALAQQHCEKLDRYLDDLIAKIAAAQEDDGYLFTARTPGRRDREIGARRWSHLRASHELYNVGHLYEAAAAHYRATGKTSLLNGAVKNASLVCRTFGSAEGQIIDVSGHEEIEIGLVRLYNITGNPMYLKQAKFFIDMRGRVDKRSRLYGKQFQDHRPVVDQDTAVGHAVRGGYLYAGVADMVASTEDRDYLEAIDRIWHDVVESKLYLTGSIGQHGAGEGYTGPYELDNVKAYCETCAAIALALWNRRMFLLHGQAKYIDMLERTIYNGFLSGIALSGDRFFYSNPLACNMKFKFNRGSLTREEWFDCACCPTNVVRFMPLIAGYVYAICENSVYVNLYVNSTARIELPGNVVKLTQHTDYPWTGDIKLILEPQERGRFTLNLRIPGWTIGHPVPSELYRYLDDVFINWGITINGCRVNEIPTEEGYATPRVGGW